jgi:hypothetical protein
MNCRDAWPRAAAVASALAVGLAMIGCAPVSDSVPVRGVVLLDGKPLPCGIVQFQPAAGQAASGEIAPDGSFTLSRLTPTDGVPPGTYRVSVLAYDPQASTRSDETLLVPLKYTRFGTSGIEFTVFPGSVEPVVVRLSSDEAAAQKSADGEGGSSSSEATPAESSTGKGVVGEQSAATGSDS